MEAQLLLPPAATAVALSVPFLFARPAVLGAHSDIPAPGSWASPVQRRRRFIPRQPSCTRDPASGLQAPARPQRQPRRLLPAWPCAKTPTDAGAGLLGS